MNICKAPFFAASLLATAATLSAAITPTETGSIPLSPSVTAGTSSKIPTINGKAGDSTRTRTVFTDDGEEWEIVDDGENYFKTEDGEEWRVA
mmetsp:Transcript_34513/g.75539  ORF Transcript_34513/g.75539 Transcript_34513/m.75539 type:complete len:92 (-) Transcript_34513:288-563(-)